VNAYTNSITDCEGPVARHYGQRESCRIEKEESCHHEHCQGNQFSRREQVAGIGRHPHARDIHRCQHGDHKSQDTGPADSAGEGGKEQSQIRRQQAAIRRE
jgi:hypothetical protein